MTARQQEGALAGVGVEIEESASPFGVRHRTAREAVVASQRGRILEAMVKAVAKKGYAKTTLTDVVAVASVSRRTFYEQFRDKEECFLAAFDTGLRFLFARMQQEFAAQPSPDWREHIRVNFETYLATLAAEPAFAKVVHVDALAAGEQARARWAELLRRLVAFFRTVHETARAEDPRIPPVNDEALLVLCGGVPEVVREYVRTGRVAELPSLAPALTDLAIAIIAGSGQETRAVEEASRPRSARRSRT